ncbi:integrin alpha-PS5-like [Ostrinia nubilalis]|uniref:integrin alpha-PS5-like n=1 Tax=Ostrinia nubilalis TaxID=29057 RepID=UPI0030822C9B
MRSHSWAMYLALVLSVIWEVGGVYHEKSMETFSPPSKSSGSLFGYSIAYQPESKKLMTSAPKHATDNIYECEIGTKKCDQIKINDTDGYKYDYMWLGATVATGHNFTVACAPRFTVISGKIGTRTYSGTYSRCYLLSGHDVTEMQQLEYERLTPAERNMKSFGWSANVDIHDAVVIGGPAMHTGRAILYENVDASPRSLNYAMIAKSRGKMEANFNFGYSVTSGYFRNVTQIMYAISSTYGVHGVGKVVVTDLKNSWVLPQPYSGNREVGSLYGAAMASASLLGPGRRQALLVGAPRYAEKGRIDAGLVYIYQYHFGAKAITPQKKIFGTKDNGQFGSAIISLGDLNGDKRDEVAIAAPYEDGGGAVYIYSGERILSEKAEQSRRWLQRLQPGSRAFGLSLTALRDYDDNGCNELAIGAPYSDKVFLLRCMSKIIVNVKYLEQYKQPPFSSARRNDTYFVFESCLDIEFPEKPKTVEADILLKVSITHKDAKLENATGNAKSVDYPLKIQDRSKTSECVRVGFIIPKVTGYDPSIQYQITATQTNSPTADATFSPSRAVLSDLSRLSASDKVWVADCAGAGGECRPVFVDAIMSSSLKDDYVIGSSDTETVSFHVSNTGDVAYSACAKVATTGVRVGTWPLTCKLGKKELSCEPQAPVEKNTTWLTEEIKLDMTTLKSNDKEIKITILFLPNCQTTKGVLKLNFTRKLLPDYKGIALKKPTEDIIELTKEELIEDGKHTSHVYTVANTGLTTWVNLRCEIVIEPKFFYNDTTVTVDTQGGSCEPLLKNKDGQYTTTCTIVELRKDHKFDVIIPIYIEPGLIDPAALRGEKSKVTISSRMKLVYENQSQEISIVSKLKLNEAVVPLWVIIIAALVGLLIIIIIVVALYELGFLRRKKRNDLKRLRNSVRRQTIRRSMRVESMRASAGADRPVDEEKLIQENGTNDEHKGTDPPVQSTDPPKKSTDRTYLPEKSTDLPETSTDSPKNSEPNNDTVKYTKANDDPDIDNDKCKIIKNHQIIRGLQKNLTQNRSLTHLAVTPKEPNDNALNTHM